MAYPLPSEHERRALFCWLEQASSLTAWRRLFTYHERFVDVVRSVYEEEQRTPGMEQTIPTKWFTLVLHSHDAFDAAVARLSAGDRRCFDFLGARGHFYEGLLHVEWWLDMYQGAMFGRNGFGVEASPRWPEIEAAMTDCLLALTDIGVVLQRSFTDVPAPIYNLRVLTPDSEKALIKNSLIKWWLERGDLPVVSIANPEVLVPTGQVVPHYGIWEPVQVPATEIEALPTARPASPPHNRPLDGCMNYLHAGSPAPTIAFEGDGQRREGRPTTWRLLWRDDRYGSNAVPLHEISYVFVQPAKGDKLFGYLE
jgi:hypothetical protein